jgi:hypothetical protein
VSLYLKQTVSEKPIRKFFLALLGTLYVTPYNYLKGFKVKILIKMGNSQVTKAFNSLLGTSEAIRLLSINIYINHRSYIKINHPEKPKDKSKS